MLELTSTNEEIEPLHSSPLMMCETQHVQPKNNEEEDPSEKNDEEYYGADPLSTEGAESSPPPPPSSFSSSSPQQPLSSRPTINRKLMLLLPLLLCLYMLTDSDYYENNEERPPKRHHLAFVTALSRHPPSLRVFRIVSEGAFLLFCTAFALWVWEGASMDTSMSATENTVSVLNHEKDESLEGDSLESDPSKNSTKKDDSLETSRGDNLRITPQAVGRLLFTPPPNSITTNAAWVVYQRHQPLRRRRKQKKKSSSNIENIEIEPTIESSENNESWSQEQQQPPLPPSSTSVLGAALDVSTLMCVFLIFFTISSAEGGRYIDDQHDEQSSWMKVIANIAAPLFPLTLFFAVILMVTLPWQRRKALYTIVSLTIGAPFYEVTFRDGFLGDILTSTVRPLQDLAFTVFYFLPMGLKAWWTSQQLYTMDAAAIPWERSWMLHTVVLPACTLSPLWWRYLQNLRQCYDAKQRWPYLGNALKYLLAAEVAIFGVFDPSVKKSPLWMTCFFIATMYQVWWDVFMDWGLLERDPSFGYNYFHATNSNGDGRSWLWWWPYSLRSQRLYRRKWVYHVIFGINLCLRFVGMITLIPPVYLSRSTGLIVNTFNDTDFQLFVGSLVASAEIFRRTIWALLRLEWEVIRTSSSESCRKNKDSPMDNDNGVGNLLEEEEMKPMAIASSEMVAGREHGRAWPFTAKKIVSVVSLSDMSNLNEIQILSELCVWATIFSGIAIIAAAHREVL